ncbi:MAG: hypothetical protein IKK50_08925 [Ruminiclostridium sp.]|nr:hypothetical protein [Ruminiclostridium sp.]
MKRLYLWMNRQMKWVAVAFLGLAVPAMILPDLFLPMVGMVVAISFFFGIGDHLTGWWEEIKDDLPDT